jgi:hypothetical protein
VIHTLRAFPPDRHADLWSGVGLAATYAGGGDLVTLSRLRAAAGPYSPQLAQGAAFAAKARLRAGMLPDHTDGAATVLCGMSATCAAAVTDTALRSRLPGDVATPGYERWRSVVQEMLTTTYPAGMSRG